MSEKEVLLTFLKETREGKYAPVDCSAANFVRLEEQTEAGWVG